MTLAIDDRFEVWDSGYISIPYDFQVGELKKQLSLRLIGTEADAYSSSRVGGNGGELSSRQVPHNGTDPGGSANSNNSHEGSCSSSRPGHGNGNSKSSVDAHNNSGSSGSVIRRSNSVVAALGSGGFGSGISGIHLSTRFSPPRRSVSLGPGRLFMSRPIPAAEHRRLLPRSIHLPGRCVLQARCALFTLRL